MLILFILIWTLVIQANNSHQKEIIGNYQKLNSEIMIICG
jgi:hypothetical protein